MADGPSPDVVVQLLRGFSSRRQNSIMMPCRPSALVVRCRLLAASEPHAAESPAELDLLAPPAGIEPAACGLGIVSRQPIGPKSCCPRAALPGMIRSGCSFPVAPCGSILCRPLPRRYHEWMLRITLRRLCGQQTRDVAMVRQPNCFPPGEGRRLVLRSASGPSIAASPTAGSAMSRHARSVLQRRDRLRRLALPGRGPRRCRSSFRPPARGETGSCSRCARRGRARQGRLATAPMTGRPTST